MKPNKERRIKVRFQADTAATMQWNFRPQQTEVTLYAGETALAFYTVGFPLYLKKLILLLIAEPKVTPSMIFRQRTRLPVPSTV